MADLQVGNSAHVAARGGTGTGNINANINGGTTRRSGLAITNAASLTIDQLRTRLTAINATSYSSARLDTMSYNDMVYAVRLADHPTSI